MPSSTDLSPDAVGAWLALGGTLARLAEAGHPWPCLVDPKPFTSDSATERREAAAACVTACPALSACARFADAQGEVHHVWAGEDRTTTSTRRTKTTGVIG